MSNIIRFEDFSDSDIRVTEDGRFSIFDVIKLCGKQNPSQVWTGDIRKNGLIHKFPELVHKVESFKFSGRGQQETPVANKQNTLYVIGLLPGAIGRAYRESAARVFLQYLEASPELAGSIIDRASPEDLAKIKQRLHEKEQDRLNSREHLKNTTRLRLTDQIKNHLEKIQRYSDKKYTSFYFAQVHDAINRAITTQTAKEMRERLKVMFGREIKESELIRDFFPIITLQYYMTLCDGTGNFVLRKGLEPLEAVNEAILYSLPADYYPKPIDFAKDINQIRARIEENKAIAEGRDY